ncbi:MAG: MBL fold metallo-hydrolase [Actinomycetota bacterium]|nr:MBL fold metallo-hydrolase [Actinomycetota bacterium]
MKVTLWGTRGSLPSAGPETVRYGGNSSCVEVRPQDGGLVVLDAGSGLRRLGDHVGPVERIDVLLTHLHLDHILGLGFFAPLYQPDVEVHLWGPATAMFDLRARLSRYLNPPLFPVRLPDLPSQLVLHGVAPSTFELPGMEVTADLICHPGLAVGYRLTDGEGTLAYLPDHEPALGCQAFPTSREWTSGADLSLDADLLIHDAQYTQEEYAAKVGWGHSAVTHAVAFAQLVVARHLVAFHHDPWRTDDELDRLWNVSRWPSRPQLEITPAREGDTFTVAGT